MVAKDKSGVQTINLQKTAVIITRPLGTSCQLIKEIKALFGTPIEIPALSITDAEHPQDIWTEFSRVNDYDYLLFTSPNSVEYAFKYNLELSPQFKIIALGSGTEKKLREYIDTPIIKGHKPYTSESLIEALNPLSLADKRILIISGKGGRRLLGNLLQQKHGAVTKYIDVYQREKPQQFDFTLVRSLVEEKIPIILLISSQEALEYLHDALVKNSLIQAITSVIVGSERLKVFAQSLNYHQIIVAKSALESDMLDTLKQYAHALNERGHKTTQDSHTNKTHTIKSNE